MLDGSVFCCCCSCQADPQSEKTCSRTSKSNTQMLSEVLIMNAISDSHLISPIILKYSPEALLDLTQVTLKTNYSPGLPIFSFI